ncbi:3-phosphoshikimate 1-carboxyvinyltransferase [Desulfamplus magnetovallimortis]|uniref:3-phosphoshikimate 1-carboxyvinyltransferase n=1 Tax=Desulfamplus magnetovallimortis TaxID=1246637 RepID=A0A1W1H519_9BACT|nr:3-phosphoshikimate 1-carboxyvinyltransferase [Desulfamplus magnetovallimortis]SLM27475.1 3-phosphoshikimate 1-carboxyvinyltransferase [Desulfamplus magnetovallimortis]
MKSIKKRNLSPCTVTIPGSKSISHRMLICSSMASGVSIVKNILNSDDIQLTISALARMGAVITKKGNTATSAIKSLVEGDCVEVKGFGGHPTSCIEHSDACSSHSDSSNEYAENYSNDSRFPLGKNKADVGDDNEIYLGNSGTSMRLIAGIAGLGKEAFVLTGDERMQQRPMGDLLDALQMAGVSAESRRGDGTPPVIIRGGDAEGGDIILDCSQSSQYLSAMLMMGAALPKGLNIMLPGKAVSAPYVDLTIDIMKQFGVHAERISETSYKVSGNQKYEAGYYVVEPDLSNASYFWAAGAVSGSMVTVTDINRDSLQGDKRLLDIFQQMGCLIKSTPQGIGVCGPSSDSSSAISSKERRLSCVEVDMSDIPDVVPTLAVVASFASGTTKVVNIAHLREKECDRISAVVSQLRKMGVDASEGDDWLSVTGCNNHNGAIIETFNDHRIAMAFSIAGLRVQGIEIENEGCVAKSFPNYWDKFDSLGEKGGN